MIARVLRIRGLVQGVGFRPYVWRLANQLGLSGWVRNDSAGVTVAVDGEKVAEFLARLPRELPVLARIDGIEIEKTGDRPRFSLTKKRGLSPIFQKNVVCPRFSRFSIAKLAR